jgi:hypothetical protein
MKQTSSRVSVEKGNKLASLFMISCHRIIPKFVHYVNRIYSIELEIKVRTETARSASYLDLHVRTETARSASYLDLHVRTETARSASYLDLHIRTETTRSASYLDLHI